MKTLFLSFVLSFNFCFSFSQKIEIKPSGGIQTLNIGDSYEKVQAIIGFGKLKTYDQYVADELFDRDPGKTLECLLGFDHYMKFEYLIPLPVHYIFFKDDRIVQIIASSIPEYFRAICEDVSIKENIKFWDDKTQVKSGLGTANLVKNDDYRMLESHVYLDQGIAFDFRDAQLRIAHVFKVPDPSVGNPILQKLTEN